MESPDQVFKDFEFSEEQVEIFNRLRKEVGKEIDDILLAVIICQKKTFEKCISSAEKMMDIVKKRNFSKISLNENQFGVIFKEMIVFDENFRSIDGNHVVLMQPPILMKEKSLTLDEKIELYLFAMHLCLWNYPKISTEGLLVCVDLKLASVRYLDVNLIKSIHGIIKKLPFRPTKICVINAPWFFRVVFSIVSPFMAGKIIKRVSVVDQKTLLKSVDENNLTPTFGGKGNHRMADTLRKSFLRKKDKDSFQFFSESCKKFGWEFEDNYELKKKEEEEEEEEEEEGEEEESGEEEEDSIQSNGSDEEKNTESSEEEEEEEGKKKVEVNIVEDEEKSDDDESSSSSEEDENET